MFILKNPPPQHSGVWSPPTRSFTLRTIQAWHTGLCVYYTYSCVVNWTAVQSDIPHNHPPPLTQLLFLLIYTPNTLWQWKSERTKKEDSYTERSVRRMRRRRTGKKTFYYIACNPVTHTHTFSVVHVCGCCVRSSSPNFFFQVRVHFFPKWLFVVPPPRVTHSKMYPCHTKTPHRSVCLHPSHP
jgi:hypothetical protein